MFTAKSPTGYDIVCTTETWDNIVSTKHPVMKDNQNKVVDAITEPVAIFRSSQAENRHVYFGGKTTYSPYKNSFFTKVVVEVDENNKTGEIKSSWPQMQIAGGIVEDGGLLYVKPKIR